MNHSTQPLSVVFNKVGEPPLVAGSWTALSCRTFPSHWHSWGFSCKLSSSIETSDFELALGLETERAIVKPRFCVSAFISLPISMCASGHCLVWRPKHGPAVVLIEILLCLWHYQDPLDHFQLKAPQHFKQALLYFIICMVYHYFYGFVFLHKYNDYVHCQNAYFCLIWPPHTIPIVSPMLLGNIQTLGFVSWYQERDSFMELTQKSSVNETI